PKQRAHDRDDCGKRESLCPQQTDDLDSRGGLEQRDQQSAQREQNARKQSDQSLEGTHQNGYDRERQIAGSADKVCGASDHRTCSSLEAATSRLSRATPMAISCRVRCKKKDTFE